MTDKIILIERKLNEINGKLIELKEKVEQNYLYYKNHLDREHKKS